MNVSGAISVVRLSDVGMLRDHNEDAVASDLSIGLVVLADGMGGYKAGEIASEVAVLMVASEVTATMHDQSELCLLDATMLPESQMLINAVEKTNAAIYEISQHQPQCAGMGTTLVAGIFTNNQLVVGHIGDSRMYCLRENVLTQLTQDHSLVQEQINAGLITQAQAQTAKNKNLVTRALGVEAEVSLEINEYDVQVGDWYLLCSDGLSDLLKESDIVNIMLQSKGNITVAANQLVEKANLLGGADNISVIIAKINKPFKAKKRWTSKLFSG